MTVTSPHFRHILIDSDATSKIYTNESEELSPTSDATSRSLPSVLKFRPPGLNKITRPLIQLPELSAGLADKLQWLSIEHPYAAAVVEQLVNGLIRKYSARPALRIELSSQYEYREVNVHNPAALLAPAEGRIGRKFYDLMPHDLVDTFERSLFAARRTGKEQTYQYGGWKGIVRVPKSDLVLIDVTEPR